MRGDCKRHQTWGRVIGHDSQTVVSVGPVDVGAGDVEDINALLERERKREVVAL